MRTDNWMQHVPLHKHFTRTFARDPPPQPKRLLTNKRHIIRSISLLWWKEAVILLYIISLPQVLPIRYTCLLHPYLQSHTLSCPVGHRFP